VAHDVFISHSAHDKPIADAVCSGLEANRIRCWIAPRDILSGRSWASAIIDGIEGARGMVVVFSGHANASQQVLREVERAVNKGLWVISFRIEDVTPSKELEFFLSAPHWLDAVTPPVQDHVRRLALDIAKLLELPPVASPVPVSPEGVPEADPEFPPDQWTSRPGSLWSRLLSLFADRS
jgi:hypothetical protein